MTFSQTIQQKIDNCIKSKSPFSRYLSPTISIGFEPFSNVTQDSRLENKRRMMYYFLKSRGRDADWVFDNSFTNDDITNRIDNVKKYLNKNVDFPGEEQDIQSPEDVYWFLYLFGDIPIDFSVVDDCVVNWNSVEALSKFISDINNQHLFLNQDGTISFTTLGNLHHESTQKGFKDCYELPFSGNQLDRSKIIEKKDILIPNFRGDITSNAGVQQKVSLNNCVTAVINGLKTSGKYDAAIQQYGSLEALKQQVTLDCQKKMDTAENKEESKTPWGWILGGAVALVAGGAAVWYLSSSNKSSGTLRASEPARRQGKQIKIKFYDKNGLHVLGSDGTIVILPSEGIKSVQGAMRRLREIKKLNHIPPWAESYMILDYDKKSSYGLPTTMMSGSIDSI